MDVVNCPHCGKVFRQIKSPFCPACEKKEELIFQSIKEYIEKNPDSTIGDLSEGTGVSSKKILRYIREGRLDVSEGMRGDVRCEVCGRPISRGRYCDACMIKMNQKITDMFSKNFDAPGKDAIMHTSLNSKSR
ncbi:MAG: hypothetical protein LBB94_08255 [Clostridiales bacterium]|jgi:predicted amidophosphoribosyltransferase|nr:hypothetical protein [Clostridiales bacterium]